MIRALIAIALFSASTSFACELPSSRSIFQKFAGEYPGIVTSEHFNLDQIPGMPRGIIGPIAVRRTAEALRLQMPELGNTDAYIRIGMKQIPGCSAPAADQLRQQFGIPTLLVTAYKNSPYCIAKGLALAAKKFHCRIK